MRVARVIVVAVFVAGVVGAIDPVGGASEPAHLSQAITAASPASGGDLLVDSIAAFEPGWGQAVVDPGTASEEILSYNGIGTDPLRLFGVNRENPVDHAEGAIVAPLGGDGEHDLSPPMDDHDAVDVGEDQSASEAATAAPTGAVGAADSAATTTSENASASDDAQPTAPDSDIIYEICQQFLQGCDRDAIVASVRSEICLVNSLLCDAVSCTPPACIPPPPDPCTVSATVCGIDVDIDPLGVVDDGVNIVDNVPDLHGHCTATTVDVYQNGSKVVGDGVFYCQRDAVYIQHNELDIKVCLHTRTIPGGVWVQGPCDGKPAYDADQVGDNVSMPCLEGKNKYRLSTEGWAYNDDGDLVHHDKDKGYNYTETFTCNSIGGV